jgi:DNA-binding Lrp family transcriptional regulator
MFEMGTVYVLINCDLGCEEEVIDKLKSISGVKEAQGTFGAYDILAKIESDELDKIRDTITHKIRQMDRVRSTLTLMTVTGKNDV